MPPVISSCSIISDPPPATGSTASFLKMSVTRCGLWAWPGVCRLQLRLLQSSKSVSHTVSWPSSPLARCSFGNGDITSSLLLSAIPGSVRSLSPLCFHFCSFQIARRCVFTAALGETNRRSAPAKCTLRLSVLRKAGEGCASLLCCEYTSDF